MKKKGLNDNAFCEWHKVLKALNSNKITVKNTQEIQAGKNDFNPALHTKRGIIQYPDLTQKRILQEVSQGVEYIPNGTQEKVNEILQLEDQDLALAFKNFRKDNPCTWKQEFQYKLLSGIVYSNKAYHRMGYKNSSNCTFCNQEDQTFIHTYLECPEVKTFRDKLSREWQGDVMSKKRWFLGVSQTTEVLEKCKNIIAKEANHFIFKTNYAGDKLTVQAFKNWLKSDEEPEEALACRVNKTFDHHLKWSNIQLLLELS